MDQMGTEALEYLGTLPFQSRPVESQFRRMQVRAQLLQGDYNSGVSILKEILEFTDQKTVGWFNSYQLLIQIYLMTAEYGLAFESYEKGIANRGFKTLP